MLNNEELQKIQHLARLSFTKAEEEVFTSKLENILDMIGQLSQVDCLNVEPLRSVCEMNQRMTEDQVTEPDISSELFNNISGETAKFAKEIKCFVVPKVIE